MLCGSPSVDIARRILFARPVPEIILCISYSSPSLPALSLPFPNLLPSTDAPHPLAPPTIANVHSTSPSLSLYSTHTLPIHYLLSSSINTPHPKPLHSQAHTAHLLSSPFPFRTVTHNASLSFPLYRASLFFLCPNTLPWLAPLSHSLSHPSIIPHRSSPLPRPPPTPAHTSPGGSLSARHSALR